MNTMPSKITANLLKVLSKLLSTEHKETAYLTGLRAYAALGVFLIHSGGGGLRSLGDGFNRFVEDGKWGVIVFFVLSGYVISLSLLKSKNYTYGSYFVRRCLRILPLYFLLVLILWGLGYQNYWTHELDTPNDIWSVLAHISFYNIIDQRYVVSSMGVEWTIPIEFFFYLLIPMFLWCLSSWRKIPVLVALCVAIYMSQSLFPNMMPIEYRYLHKMFLPHTYLPLFVGASIMAYITYHYGELLDRYKPFIAYGSIFMIVVLMTLRYAFFDLLPDLLSEGRVFYALISGAIILAGIYRNIIVKIILENRVVVYLGNISFSFYLLHFPILYYVGEYIVKGQMKFFVALLLCIALSSVTYILIERPFLNMHVYLRKQRGG